jgi:excinuclease UvrABC nuclease subunit
MAWSYSIRLRDYFDVPREPGIYEIGFIKNNIFNPLYVGKAENSIYDRLKKHYLEKGKKKC